MPFCCFCRAQTNRRACAPDSGQTLRLNKKNHTPSKLVLLHACCTCTTRAGVHGNRARLRCIVRNPHYIHYAFCIISLTQRRAQAFAYWMCMRAQQGDMCAIIRPHNACHRGHSRRTEDRREKTETHTQTYKKKKLNYNDSSSHVH